MRRSLAIFAVTLLFSSFSAGDAHAAVYWGNDASIGAANLDGSYRQPAYFRPNFETYGQITALAVSSEYLYWGGRGGIGRVSLHGPEIEERILASQSPITGIALDDSHIYWTTEAGEAIGRANLDGSSPQDFIGGLKGACGIAVDSQHIYWASSQSIGRAGLDGLEVERSFLPDGGLSACGVTLAGGYLYWASRGGDPVKRAPVGGGAYEEVLAGLGAVSALTSDSTHLYWTADGSGYSEHAPLGRSDLDGSSPEPEWIRTDTRGALAGLAVDFLPSPPLLPPPSAPVRITGIRHDSRGGAVLVDVDVPAPGRLRVVARRFAWKVIGKSRRQAEITPGRWRLKLWLGRGATAASLRRRLFEKGRARTRLRILFREAGKEVWETQRSIVFVRASTGGGRRG